ncbi:Type-2 restriction enzyme PvuII [Phycisphaerae bacterium RAS2]|nr:Type-2 restriction enzyme PvuII [Phycisphaerae bacterium RAS2]
MTPHLDYEELRRLFPAVRAYQELASKHGIADIFQDNGGKILQVLLLTGLTHIASREGNDARDADGREYELKSVNIELRSVFTTHHHMNPRIIAKYRTVDWVFAIYRNIELAEVYLVTAAQLESFFEKWETKWHTDGERDINNPKIPVRFVRDVGKLIYKSETEKPEL